jgi:adenine-specific DNA-methyltransferase
MPTLDWLHRNAAFRLAREVPHRQLDTVSTHGTAGSGNLLVQGDNLQTLKALLPLYRAQVKCIFIDPPYNTKSAFEHYDDNLEHSQWLSMMLPRLQLLREFLREDGSIWVTIDDNEGHYLKVLMDEVFGRDCFVTSFAWQKTLTRRNDAKVVSAAHDHVLLYGRVAGTARLSRLEADAKQRATYTNRDNDPRGDWLAIPLHAPNLRPNLTYPIITPGGRELWPPAGRCWSTTREQFDMLNSDGRVYFGRDGNGMAQRKKFWSESEGTVVPWTWWPYEETGENREATREAKELALEAAAFDTPKPERLIHRALSLATNPGDLVLDSFLGSGTTAAVAHKMGRRWIGIEMGEHAQTHCLPRLEKVIAGERGGISAAVDWQGGGGFDFVRLGEPVFAADGQLNPQVRFAALAAFVWQQETRTAYRADLPGAKAGTPLLGLHEGRAVHLLYNGILGDRRPAGGNVLTLAVLRALKLVCPHGGPRVIYGEACLLGSARLAAEGIAFRQIPYELSAR